MYFCWSADDYQVIIPNLAGVASLLYEQGLGDTTADTFSTGMVKIPHVQVLWLPCCARCLFCSTRQPLSESRQVEVRGLQHGPLMQLSPLGGASAGKTARTAAVQSLPAFEPAKQDEKAKRQSTYHETGSARIH